MTRHPIAVASALAAVLLAGCSGTPDGEGPAPMPLPASSAKPHSALTARLFPSRWVALDVAGVAVAGGGRITLAFADDGAVSGSGGCNRYVGQATLQDEQLIFAPLATTRMACPGGSMEQETRYLKVLGMGGAVAFTADGGLVIAGPDAAAPTRFAPDTTPPAPSD